MGDEGGVDLSRIPNPQSLHQSSFSVSNRSSVISSIA